MQNRITRPDFSQLNLEMSSIHPEQEQTIHRQNPFAKENNTTAYSDDEFANEPPLLEDLGIDIDSVKSKLLSTILFLKPNTEFVQKPDMTGPFLIGTALGFFLALVC